MVNEKSVKDNNKSDAVNLDRMLVEEVGQFRKFQFKVILLCAIVHICTGYSQCDYLYTTAKIRHRCMIPECEKEEKFSPTWILNAVPESGDTFESCRRFNDSSESENVTMDSTCPQNMFDRGSIVECEDYVYEDQNSAVYEFDLACDEWRRSLIGFVSVLGMMLGLPVVGFFSDRYGRRITLSITAFNYAWIGIMKYWAVTYETYVVVEFVEHLLGASSFTCAYILALEFVGPKHRVAVGTLLVICLGIGNTLQALVTWTQPHWRHFILFINVPQLVAIFYFWVSPESVRWLLSKGRFEEAKIILLNIAQSNGTELSEKTFTSFQVDEKKKNDYIVSDAEEPWLISLVFRHKAMILRCLITPVWWVSALLVFFGLMINSVDIVGNKYLNYVAVNVVAIPGYVVGYWSMNVFGRKPVIIGGFWICGICQLAYIFIPLAYNVVSLCIYLIGKMSISAVISAIYVYTSELYPTRHRGNLICYSSMIGRFGSLLAPLTPSLGFIYWQDLPFALFGCMALISGLLVMLSPETLGTTLPDTMEEAANLGKSRPLKHVPMEFVTKL